MFFLQSLLLFGLAAVLVWGGGEGVYVTVNNALVCFNILKKCWSLSIAPLTGSLQSVMIIFS